MVNMIKFIFFLITKDKNILIMLSKIIEGIYELMFSSIEEGKPRMRHISFEHGFLKKEFAFWFGEYSGTPLERIEELAKERNYWKEKYFETLGKTNEK